jgi:hypothetical protein
MVVFGTLDLAYTNVEIGAVPLNEDHVMGQSHQHGHFSIDWEDIVTDT